MILFKIVRNPGRILLAGIALLVLTAAMGGTGVAVLPGLVGIGMAWSGLMTYVVRGVRAAWRFMNAA